MKIKNLLWLSLAMALLTAACSTTNKDDGYIDDGRGIDDVTTYMSVRLIGEQGGTRTTPGSDGTETGSTAENTIGSALVLLVDKNDNTGKVGYAVSADVEPTKTGANTKPFKVSEGTYYVYVIANPGDITKDVVETKTIQEIEILMYENGKVKDYAAAGKFLMFNECNGTDDTAGMEIEVTAQNTIDNPAQSKTPIKLDRLAAKLASTAGTVDITGLEEQLEDIADVSLKGFVLLNGAKKAYLQQHWSGVKQEEGVWPYENTLITPVVTFNDFYSTYSDYAEILDGSVKDLAKDLEWDKEPVYCMENRAEINGESGLKGSSTGIIYCWQVTNAGSDELAGENCFYSYNGEYFSSIKDLQDAYRAVFSEQNEWTDDQDELDDQYDAAVELLGQDIAAFRSKYLIKVYEDGVMYYTFYIKDQNYVSETEEDVLEHYYSVMRNTIYNLNVTTLVKIGTDIPGGWGPDPKPTDPIDTKELYMLVKTVVNDWVLSNEDISLQ